MEILVFYLFGLFVTLVWTVVRIVRTPGWFKESPWCAVLFAALMAVLSWFGFMMLLIAWSDSKDKEQETRINQKED